MTLITFPSNVIVTRSDLELVHPGQTVLRSIYGTGAQVLGRGPGFWRGRLGIAETDMGSDAQRRAIELFLTKLRGAVNTFECPIHRPSAGTLEAGKTLTVSAAALSAGVLITVTGATEGLVSGDYVRIGDRLYQLSAPHANSNFTVEPPVKPDAGDDIVWEEVTCLARLAPRQSSVRSNLTWDFGGPWTLEWEEAV